MAKLTVVISAYNEEKNIKDCLLSVKDLTDEIVVVDNKSTDKTAILAAQSGAKVYSQINNLMLNVNKNYGFNKATGDWILNLDADERLTPELATEIRAVIEQSNNLTMGFWLPRQNLIFGKWIKSEMWWPDYQLRLFKRGKGKFPQENVHEYLQVEGETEKLKNFLVHQNYSTVSQFINKMDKIYSEDGAENILKSGRRLSWVDALRFPLDDFLKTFFLQKGYKDGLHGLVLSLLQAFYSEVTFAKVWEKRCFKEEEIPLKKLSMEFVKSIKELKYWIKTMLIEENRGIGKIFLKIKRKFLR